MAATRLDSSALDAHFKTHACACCFRMSMFSSLSTATVNRPYSLFMSLILATDICLEDNQMSSDLTDYEPPPAIPVMIIKSSRQVS